MVASNVYSLDPVDKNVEYNKNNQALKPLLTEAESYEEIKKLNKQNNKQTVGLVRKLQSATAKQVLSEGEDKCVLGKRRIGKERLQIIEPFTDVSSNNILQEETRVHAKFQNDDKVREKKNHKCPKDIVDRYLTKSHNKVKMDAQKQDSNKCRKESDSNFSFPVVGRHFDDDRNPGNYCTGKVLVILT